MRLSEFLQPQTQVAGHEMRLSEFLGQTPQQAAQPTEINLPGRMDAQPLPYEPGGFQEAQAYQERDIFAEGNQAAASRQAGLDAQQAERQDQIDTANQQAEANKYHYQTNALAVEDWIASLPDYVPGESGEQQFNQRLYKGPNNPMPPEIQQAFQQLHHSHQQEMWQKLQQKIGGQLPELTTYQSAGAGMGEGWQGIKKAGAGLQELMTGLNQVGGTPNTKQSGPVPGADLRDSANTELRRLAGTRDTGEGGFLRGVARAGTTLAPAAVLGPAAGVISGPAAGVAAGAAVMGAQGAGGNMEATRDIMIANGQNPDDARGRRMVQAILQGVAEAGSVAVGGPGIGGAAKMGLGMGVANYTGQVGRQAVTNSGEIDPGQSLEAVIQGLLFHYLTHIDEIEGAKGAAQEAYQGAKQAGKKAVQWGREQTVWPTETSTTENYQGNWRPGMDPMYRPAPEAPVTDVEGRVVPEPPPAEQPQPRLREKPLTEYSVAELRDIAAGEGIGIPKTLKKSDIVEAIERAERERQPTGPGYTAADQSIVAQAYTTPKPDEYGSSESWLEAVRAMRESAAARRTASKPQTPPDQLQLPPGRQNRSQPPTQPRNAPLITPLGPKELPPPDYSKYTIPQLKEKLGNTSGLKRKADYIEVMQRRDVRGSESQAELQRIWKEWPYDRSLLIDYVNDKLFGKIADDQTKANVAVAWQWLDQYLPEAKQWVEHLQERQGDLTEEYLGTPEMQSLMGTGEADASTVRSDAGQIQPAGTELRSGASQGGPDIQQPSSPQPSNPQGSRPQEQTQAAAGKRPLSRRGAISMPTLSPKTQEILRQKVDAAVDSARRYSGHIFPSHGRLNRKAGEAAADYISSQEVSNAESALAIRRVLGRHPVGSNYDRHLGDVILEDGLRGDKQSFLDEAQQLRLQAIAAKAGSIKQKELQKKANRADKNAQAVRSIISDPNHTLPDEPTYQRLLADPEIGHGLDAHIDEVMPKLEEMYRLEAGIAANTPVPVRGRVTETYLTRKAILRDAEAQQYGPQGKAGTRKKASGLAQTAYGTADQYANTYSENVAHNFARQTKPAAQAKYYQELIKRHDATYVDGPNSTVSDPATQKPWPVFEVKIGTNVFIDKGGVQFVQPKNQYIAVRPELAKEFERITNVTNKVQPGGIVKAFSDVNTSISMMSTAEPSAHLINHVAQLYKMLVFPGKNQGALSKIGYKEANLANVPFLKIVSIAERMIPKLIEMGKGSTQSLEQTAELAHVAGLQPESQTKTTPIGRLFGAAENPTLMKYDPFAWISRGIGAFTKAARMMGLDNWKAMVKEGIVKDTPLEKSRFISQFAQYHHEAQIGAVSLARKLGVGSFASAGHNFFVQRFKGLIGSPNVKGANAFQSARLRAGTLLSAWGALAMIGLANYWLWGRMKPSGTPLGSVVYGQDDKGRYKYLPVAKWTGLSPAGVGEAASTAMEPGSKIDEVIDKGMKGFFSSLAAPYLGPGLQSGYIAATGHSPVSEYQSAEQVPEGQSQGLANLKAAAQHVNPAVAALTDETSGDTGGATKLLGAFAPRTGRKPASSAADYVANQILSRKSHDINTQEQRERYKQEHAAVEALRSGQQADWSHILPQHKQEIYVNAKTDPLAYKIKHMDSDEAMEVWRENMPKEQRGKVRAVLLQKLSNKMTAIPEATRQKYLTEVIQYAGQ